MAKIRVQYEYSEAEDKSIRLGLFLIVCGILSLFILCFCWLNPTLQNMQSKPTNCTVISVRRVEEMFECVFTCGADCKGTSLYPCLQVFVNNSESNSIALLHHDEQQLVLNPKVCYCVPRCVRARLLASLFKLTRSRRRVDHCIQTSTRWNTRNIILT
ncbi:hypothetical protein GJAV_G00271250 [Gymnothorax javanicus]|nr:hypothetical protein GJAV_G00271250 [Gymnothorax javanicus]